MVSFFRKILNKNYLLVFLIVYVSFDTVLFGTNANSIFISICYALTLGLGLYSLIVLNKRILSKYPVIFLISLSFLFTVLANHSFSGGFIIQFFVFLVAIYVVEKFEYDYFVVVFEEILFFLVCCSLFFYAISILYNGSLLSFQLENHAGNLYMHHFLYASPVSHFSLLPRNSSIFREPGVYAIYLIFGLLLSVFNRNVKTKHCIVYYIALFTTFSTAGILLGMIVLSLQLLANKSKFKYLFVVIIAVFMIGLLSFSESIYYGMIFNKLNGTGNASTVARISSITIPFDIFCSNILTGVGFENFTQLYPVYSLKQYGESFEASGMSTNYVLNMFAKFGAFIGLLVLNCIFSLSKIIVMNKRSRIYQLIVFILICAAFSNEDICFSLPFNIFLFYGLKKINYKLVSI